MTVEEKVFEQSGLKHLYIDTAFGATVFDLLKFNKDHFDLVICNCLAVTSSVMMTARTASTHYIYCFKFFAVVVQEEDAAAIGLRDHFPSTLTDSLMKGGSLM